MKTNLAVLVQKFFTKRLQDQRNVSAHTISAYRDTFKILFVHLENTMGIKPSALKLEDINADSICSFLKYLECKRRNSLRTQNARLAAIHSFFNYCSYEAPELSKQIQRVLGIPLKKHTRRIVDYLTVDEVKVLLRVIPSKTWLNRRDAIMIDLMIETGLRVSEVTGLTCEDIHFGKGAHVRCLGKGRKERCIPISKEIQIAIKDWLKERPRNKEAPFFPNARGSSLSSDGVQYILKKYVYLAKNKCPSMRKKRISPHVLRHTTAMNLLRSGIDCSVIALWLGHESIEATHIYLEADLALREEILERRTGTKKPYKRFKPKDELLTFLDSL